MLLKPQNLFLFFLTLEVRHLLRDALIILHTKVKDAIGGLCSYIFRADLSPLVKRGLVRDPLLTGVYAVDILIPVGLGLRLLILGDRQKGKISLVLDMLAAIWQQNAFFNVCSSLTTTNIAAMFFCLIGHRLFEVKNLVLYFLLINPRMHGMLNVVFTSAGEPAPFLWIAPFMSVSIGEFLILKGIDGVLFFCDLSRHANAYRQISLLIGRSPAREAYPGDVFYLHARLLERCARLGSALGCGSLTGIPVVETQEGKLSAYIPTNVISITDGQVYLNTKIFKSGIAPAIDTGLSVSRIGSVALLPSIQHTATEIRKDFAWWRFLDKNRLFKATFQDEEKEILLWGDFAFWFMVLEKLAQLPSIKSLGMLVCVQDGFFDCFVNIEKEHISVESLLNYKRQADRGTLFISALYTSLDRLEHINKIDDIIGFNLELFEDLGFDENIVFLFEADWSPLSLYYYTFLSSKEELENPKTISENIYPERNLDLALAHLLSLKDSRALLELLTGKLTKNNGSEYNELPTDNVKVEESDAETRSNYENYQ